MENKYDLSLVIACYNEGSNFIKSVKKVFEVLDETDFIYEVIFVEDKSLDKTAKKIKQILKNNPRRNLTAVYHQKNQGRGKTVTEGIFLAKGKVVGFIDIDLEVPPDYIPRFVNAILSGYHIATARRIYDFNLRSLPRWISSKGYVLLKKWLLKTYLKDTEAGYKFFKRKKILSVLKKTKDPGWFWDTEIMIRSYLAGLKIIEIPTVFIRNLEKKSTVRLIPDSLDYLIKLFQFKKEIGEKYSESFKRSRF